jgi:hypothetical protein
MEPKWKSNLPTVYARKYGGFSLWEDQEKEKSFLQTFQNPKEKNPRSMQISPSKATAQVQRWFNGDYPLSLEKNPDLPCARIHEYAAPDSKT